MASKQLVESNPLPYSEEAEKAVLGAVLRDPSHLSLLEELLTPDHFYREAHQQIFSAILQLSADSASVDIITVLDKLRQQEDTQEYIGAEFLVELTEKCPVTQNIEYYAEIVRRYFYSRRVIRTCQETIKKAQNHEGSIETFVEGIEKEFLAISGEYDRKGIMRADAVLESTIEAIQKKLESDGTTTGVPTGFTALDNLTGGLQGGDLIILAARPGMGKTALALNVATHAAMRGKSVVIFTLEMPKEQLMQRILSSVARVDSSRLRKGDLSDEEQDQLMEGARRIYAHKEYMGIDESPGISLVELRSRCRRYAKEFGLDMVIVDYLQLMKASYGGRSESREREISEISMGLKELAIELKIPVIALAQLNRGPESRPDKRPKTSDLRESGSLEQDADLILLVYRDEYYDSNSELTGIAEVIVGKNRHGSTETIKLAYQPNFVSFQNLFMEGDDSARM